MNEGIIIVSGLPRSGTSMMMKMLEAGGVKILTDHIRTADDDNPKGYFELEIVKKIDNNKEWLKGAQGKVVKIISQFLQSLPSNFNYKVVFMQRVMEEILASQKQMLIRRNEATDRISDEEMGKFFNNHLLIIESWLEKQPNFDVLYISYNEVLKNSTKFSNKISEFLGGTLNINNMANVVDQSLHRQRV